MQKADAEAGVSENQANNDTTQGGQFAGLLGGLIGAGGKLGAAALTPAAAAATPAAAAPVAVAEGGEIEFEDPVPGPDRVPDIYEDATGYKHLGESFLAEEGGSVPGKAEVSGDSPRNDKVPAILSPGEVVLPRSVAKNPQPDKVMDFLRRMRPAKPAHPDDVATVLHALGKIREVA
jgi:hypothetical protein